MLTSSYARNLHAVCLPMAAWCTFIGADLAAVESSCAQPPGETIGPASSLSDLSSLHGELRLLLEQGFKCDHHSDSADSWYEAVICKHFCNVTVFMLGQLLAGLASEPLCFHVSPWSCLVLNLLLYITTRPCLTNCAYQLRNCCCI